MKPYTLTFLERERRFLRHRVQVHATDARWSHEPLKVDLEEIRRWCRAEFVAGTWQYTHFRQYADRSERFYDVGRFILDDEQMAFHFKMRWG